MLCAISCFVFRPDASGYSVTEYVKQSYEPFIALNFHLNRLFAFPPLAKSEVFNSEFSLMVMRFIAWAYTYHYLNWFSKTSIIGWHKISKLRFTAVLVLWIGSLVLYAMDYALGFK